MITIKIKIMIKIMIKDCWKHTFANKKRFIYIASDFQNKNKNDLQYPKYVSNLLSENGDTHAVVKDE